MTNLQTHGVASLEAPLTEDDLAALDALLATSPPQSNGVLRPHAMSTVLARIAERLPNEAAAYELLEHLRWRGRPECPHCGVVGPHAYLRPANGLSRTTNRGRQSERRVWKCRNCKRQFSVITGTVMHGTHVPIRTWILVAYEIASSQRHLSDREVERRYGLSSKSAHFLLQRIRDDLARPSDVSLFRRVAGEHQESGNGYPNGSGHPAGTSLHPSAMSRVPSNAQFAPRPSLPAQPVNPRGRISIW